MDQPADDIAQIARTVWAALVQAGLIAAQDRMTRVFGGRTNMVWWITTPGGPLICKLARQWRDTPLFPNLPRDEGAALLALADTGLAPRLRAMLTTPSGPCLVYNACPGAPWANDAGPVGALLARLHRVEPPKNLRRVSITSQAILAGGDAMLLLLAKPGDLVARRPRVRPDDAMIGAAVFLHGDPVPGNIIVQIGTAPVLIDWQCPALGDPVHDLALFLSPAMQTLGRGAPLSSVERAAFLQGYANPEVAHRLSLVEAALSWRMAVYCAWRIVRGHADYGPAMNAELDHLQQLR